MLKKILFMIFSLLVFLNLSIFIAFAGDSSKIGDSETLDSSSVCSGPDCFASKEFKIDTKTFSPAGNSVADQIGFENKANFALGMIIQKMLIGIGALALFTMSIGAGYMIFYHGRDEYLSKGKTIFMAGLTSVSIALCSYYLVSFVRYVLYN